MAEQFALFAGTAGYAVVLIAQQIAFIHAENHVVSKLQRNPLAPNAANDLVKHELTHGAVATTTWLQLVIGLVLAVGVVLIAQGARRAGLLSNFLGILGIIVGVLLFVPLFGRPPVIAYFWTIALGFLFIDRWPQGRGPAWETGEAVPRALGGGLALELLSRYRFHLGVQDMYRTLSAQQQRLNGVLQFLAGRRQLEEAEAPAGGAAAHPRSKKRKRKRRR